MIHSPTTLVTLSRAQVRALDAAAIEEYGIPGIVLMENAATAIEEVVLRELEATARNCVLIVAGSGNNGGDGFALARKLSNRGLDVRVARWGEREAHSGDAAINLGIIERSGLPITAIDHGDVRGSLDFISARSDGSLLIVDALLGTGLDRPVREPMDQVIRWINQRHDDGVRVLAVDVPTGLDCDTGTPLGDACVHADVTITLAAMKVGLADDRAPRYAGTICVGDIGVPRELLIRMRHGGPV